MAQNNLGTVPVQIASPSLTSGEVLFIQDLASESAYNASNVVKMNSNNGGSALQILRVNSSGNALEWATINLGSAYDTIQKEGTPLTQRTTLNFIGDGIIASDDAANSRTNITLDATLNSISNLGTAADKIIYTTGVDTWAETTLTTFGRSLIDDANAADARTTLGLGDLAVENSPLAVAKGGTGATTAAGARTNLGLVIGTDVQAHSANLDIWATKTPPSGEVVGDTDSQVISNKNILTGINVQSGTSYTLQLSDAGKLIQMTNNSDSTVTIPSNSNVPFPIGTQITIQKYGNGNVTISPDTGVLFSGPLSIKTTIEELLGKRTILKVNTNDWIFLSDGRTYPRQNIQTSPTSIWPFKINYDEYYVTALANAITINNATSPSVGDTFVIYLTDNGTARSISWGSHYYGIGGDLPTTTTANKTMEIIIKYVGASKALVSFNNQV